MSVRLDPVVAQKLRHFRRRRFLLILARGLSSGIITFLLCFALVSLADWYWLLTDQVRWGLSLGAYATVAIVVWWSCLRRMLHRPALEEVASQMEMTEPELRENLLSAVELTTDETTELHDSPVFRKLVQNKVADQMVDIRVKRLLPIKLVASWLVVAIVLVSVCSLLLTRGDIRLRHLATRAILPGANLARVSRIQVTLLRPTPHSQTIAEDDTVAVAVDISGGSVSEVILETMTPGETAVQQSMLQQSDGSYVTNLHVGVQSVEYRVLAGDAITKRYLLESKPRPHVVAFHKTYQFPEYAQLQPETIVEQNGDLVALAGSKANVLFELNQDVSHAELRIDYDGTEEPQVIPLERHEKNVSESGNPLWMAKVPLEEQGIYKVHLVAAETGFENTFAPRYEILPQPDLIPQVGFVDQQERNLFLPPNDILSLKGMAEDDLPIQELVQEFSLNGQEWVSLDLDAQPDLSGEKPQLTAAWDWDLLKLKLEAGDQLLTRLVATDLKGNQGESVPLRIVIAATDFDPDRHLLMERKAAFYHELRQLADEFEEHKQTAWESLEKLKQDETASAETDFEILLDLAGKQRDQVNYLLEKVTDLAREMPAGADAYELELIGRLLARIGREHATSPDYFLSVEQASLKMPRGKNPLDAIKNAFSKSADDAKHVAEYYQQFMGHNFLAALAMDLDAILTQQRFVAENSTDSWERLLRQETIVLNQLEILSELLQDHSDRMPSSMNRQLRDLLLWSERWEQRFRDGMESEEHLADLQRSAREFYQEVQHKQHYANIDGGLAGRITNARYDLDRRAGQLYVPIEQLSRAVEEENKLTQQATVADDSAEGQKYLHEAKLSALDIDSRYLPELDQLRDRKQLIQARADGDAQYAADLGLTSRAINFLISQHREIPPQESMLHDALREVAFAFRTLEAGHEFQQTKIALQNLAQREQWNAQELIGRLDHPRQWELINKAFEITSSKLKGAKFEREITEDYDQIRWSPEMRDAQRKITERRWKLESPAGAGYELTQLVTRTESVEEAVLPVMAEARAIIAQYAPTIPQLARQAAEQIRQQEERTLEQTDQIAANEEKSDLQDLQQSQQEINEQLEDLMEALVEEANSKDLLQEEQREVARDADDSLALIEDAAKQMNRELQEATESDSAEAQEEQLAQAAEEQEKAADALDLVAQHFENLEQNQNVAETRSDLRQSEREMRLARQFDQQFSEPQQVEEMLKQSPEDLLAELTEELKTNLAMQQALSEISTEALENAQSTLEMAANDDQNLQRANERSDESFREQKKQLTNQLRRAGAEASRLSRDLLTQANYAAKAGQADIAQLKISEAQKKLNEIANKVNQTREDQLLSDIAQVAQEAQKQLAAVEDELKSAKQMTEQSKKKEIHKDEKAVENQKRDFERRQQQFQEQRKRVARDLARNMDNLKRQADQHVKNIENQLRNHERNVQNQKKNLDKNPDNEGLKRNLQRAQEQLAADQQKLAAAKESQQKAVQEAQQAKEKSNQENRRQLPKLNGPNPAAELSDRYTAEGVQAVDELQKTFEEIARQLDFGEELSPTKSQLASAQRDQQEITEDVQQAAQDVARAARHEERLQNQEAGEALAQLAEEIASVAQDESMNSEQQLGEAVEEADSAESNQNSDSKRSESLQAQASLAETEQALRDQAGQLSETAQALAQASQADQTATAQSETGDQQSGTQGEPSQPQAAQTPANGQTPQEFSPAEMAQAQQLAQTLDELDRQLAAQQSQAGEGEPTPSQATSLPTLAQAAQAQQRQLASQRAQAQQQAAEALNEGESESEGIPPGTTPGGEFEVAAINRQENKEWGKLRSKSAEEVSRGSTSTISEEYRKSVETYFRVLSERARK